MMETTVIIEESDGHESPRQHLPGSIQYYLHVSRVLGSSLNPAYELPPDN